MTTDSDLLLQLLSRRAGTSLPRDFYVSEAAHQADLRHIWTKEWVFAASAAELPKAGNYVTLQIGQ